MTGLEPARRKHQNLNLARLPIPPHPLNKNANPSYFERSAFLNTERAGIRTPDNLIKSQVLYHLSYTPIINWASWIRTNECRSQSPVPYRLAIAQ